MFSNVFRQSWLALIYRCSGAVVSLLFGVCFARMMNIEEYGALMSLMTFAVVASTVGLVGQQFRVLREIPSIAARKNYLEIGSIVAQRLRVACFGSVAVIVISLLLFVVARGRDGIFGSWQYSTSLLLILPLALIEMQSSLGRALGSVNLALVSKDVLWRLLIILFGGILFTTYGHPVPAEDVLAIATGILVVLIAAQNVYLRHLAEGYKVFTMAVRRSNNRIADVFFTSGPFWVTSIASVMGGTIDLLIVSVMVGPEAGGYYYAASRIALLLDFFLATFCIPAAPLIARLFDENRHAEITRVTSGASLAAFVAVFGCVVALALAGDLALMAFGGAFSRAHSILMVLSIGLLVSTYFGIGPIALNMTGHQRAAMHIVVITWAVGILAMIGATWAFGTLGAAVAGACAGVATRVWTAAYMYAAEGIDITATTTLRALVRRTTQRDISEPRTEAMRPEAGGTILDLQPSLRQPGHNVHESGR
ncbi:oligosaccharide flippase family protein [Bradyrhizobium septentrionale]|uniref:Lipopolysaccharide biosynthesis protein n=1 Tax=Bradyrhizobium septentrionale TaxID=1404411 RepID=A0ABZ2NUL9_9BRAD|nr:lipopolysaccharide biosynthesis protein [Bradyrhizobium septentrionale]UGY17339.1 lipopolysaccharide biosynthesis protein [Bradyrhizobium septentrionale]UGY26082.1 lipopolysaccharide biosynthesis protein [Bradyrhizobium septentrionale]